MMFRNMVMGMAVAFIASATPVPVPQGCPDCVSPFVLVEFFSASGCPDPSTHPGVSAQNVTFGSGANNTCTPLNLGFTVESAKFIANTEPGVTCSVVYDAACGDTQGTAGPLGACESRANGGFGGLFLRCSPPSS